MRKATFVSGWAGFADLFPGLAARYRFLVPFVDLDGPDLAYALGAGPTDLLLAWSTGAHLVLKYRHVIERYRHVFLFAPFDRFTDHVRPALLKGMINAFAEEPASTLKAFYANCGLKGRQPDVPQNSAGLRHGLEYLLQSEAITQPFTASNLTIVHGTRDRIVPSRASEELIRKIQGADLHLIDAGHWIPEQTIHTIVYETTDTQLL